MKNKQVDAHEHKKSRTLNVSSGIFIYLHKSKYKFILSDKMCPKRMIY